MPFGIIAPRYSDKHVTLLAVLLKSILSQRLQQRRNKEEERKRTDIVCHHHGFL
jgi:hypothetical protein